MIKQKYDCIICMEVISNPICKDCYMKEIEYWMKESNIDSEKKRKILRKIREKTYKNNHDTNSTCIICKKNKIDICSYCFFYTSFKVINNEKISEHQVEDFLETFNYQLGYERYNLEKEIEIK